MAGYLHSQTHIPPQLSLFFSTCLFLACAFLCIVNILRKTQFSIFTYFSSQWSVVEICITLEDKRKRGDEKILVGQNWEFWHICPFLLEKCLGCFYTGILPHYGHHWVIPGSFCVRLWRFRETFLRLGMLKKAWTPHRPLRGPECGPLGYSAHHELACVVLGGLDDHGQVTEFLWASFPHLKEIFMPTSQNT